MRTKMEKKNRPIAIAGSDFHLSMKPPTHRIMTQTDWENEVYHTIYRIREKTRLETPLLIAGDIFDTPDENPEIATLFLDEFPTFTGGVYTIPGQHDLPFHSLANIHKSNYGVVTHPENNKIIHVINEIDISSKAIVNGFAWADDYGRNGPEENATLRLRIKAFLDSQKKSKKTRIAMIHAYCHNTDKESRSTHWKTWQKAFEGYDFVIFGDNHVPFAYEETTKSPLPTVINCGGIFNRNRTEAAEERFVWALFDDKSYCSYLVNDPNDERWAVEAEDVPELTDAEITEFKNQVFVEIVKNAAGIYKLLEKATQSASPKIRQILQKIVHETKESLS